ncbi:hypothetical protein SAMN06265222_1391, partial [Neorhodopirellula lusitana]
MTESCNFSLHHDLPDDSHTADNHAVHTKIRWLEYRPSQRRPPDLGDGQRYSTEPITSLEARRCYASLASGACLMISCLR